ncbi:MAG TPA: CRISPR-associated endonuclease Cas1, partial [Candidatus Wallbacteria bacterium]|nr:CRISPR-associated endonuclease Cas1 [Candidatus Wallbacteria bacterium]
MQQEERTLYVAEQGATIAKTSHRIVIRNTSNKIIQEIPFFKIKQIIIIGRVNLTPDMIFAAFNREIDVVFV